ncbi:hypothetical protein N7478_003835 [Penicillium angulare]|uniref:uncharacterized protein n=1 Tax=Penicillium angulare TaxID=116970 RepID=UPI00253F926D|nr:uncharacterized protein N7478_003835 [Penicillium angulare]KAJ5288149.1 hypothetical protein N7478_003835 [Penicillium angulare]
MDPTLAESKLGYHGLPTKSTGNDGTAIIKGMAQTDQVKSLIRKFLEETNFDRSSPFIKDHQMAVAVWEHFKSLDLGPKMEKSVQKTLKLSVTFTHQAYTALPFEIRVLCAIQFLYMFLVDDVAEDFMSDLQAFGQNSVLNKSHNNTLLNGFDTHLRNLAFYYGPYCHSAITKSLIDYVNGRIIEHKMEQSSFKFSAESRLMPMFLRTKVGGAEILIHLLYPKAIFPEDEYVIQYFPAIQELVLFIDFTNDILSYYKEFCLDDEKGNFVANFADTHEVQHLDVLKYLTSYTPRLLKSVYQLFGNNSFLLQSVENFTRGWIMLCTAHRRYHLVELFAEEQYLPPYDEDA